MLKLSLLFVLTVLVAVFSFLAGNALSNFDASLNFGRGSADSDARYREFSVSVVCVLVFVLSWLSVAVVMP